MLDPQLLSIENFPLYTGMLIALAVFAAAMVLGRSLRKGASLRRRVNTSSSIAGLPGGLHARDERQVSRLLARAAEILAPSGHAPNSGLRKQLVRAGFFSEQSLVVFQASRLACACLMPLLFLVLATVFHVRLPVLTLTLLSMLLAVFGLILPPILLDRRGQRMQRVYRHAFPDLMDLLVVCVESGQSVQSAIARVGQEMMLISAALGFNLHLLSLELRAGSTLEAGLMSMYGRIGLDEVRSLAVLLKQTEQLGASISNTLRVFSEEMRDKRLSRAETRANSLPVKMTIPLGLFIFPVIMLVVLVPVIIRIRNALL